jgi:transposase
VTPEETTEHLSVLGLVRHLQRGMEQLKVENQCLREQLAALTLEKAALEAEIAKLRQTIDPPSFVKPNASQGSSGEKKERKKRTVNGARPREEPTREVQHTLDQCPKCEGPLSPGYEKRRRQVIDLPVTPVEVIDHVFCGYWCGYCGKEQVATASPEELGVVGECRMGVRLMSFVAHLHIEGRMPLATIQQFLSVGYGLSISVGELTEILHLAAKQGAGERQAILEAIRAAPVVHADETGWRENGQNGYVWSFSTPPDASEPLRYFHFIQSRGGKVVAQILGLDDHPEVEPGEEEPFLGTFFGKLVVDFYSAYSAYSGRIQRCWVHLLRALHELKRRNPTNSSVFAWAAAIHAVYDRAVKWKPEHPDTRFEERERLAAQHDFEEELRKLAQLYLDQTQAPQHVLAKRIEKHLQELFVFVGDPRVPSDNNNAERSVRPTVIARKISGGTRSARGSETKMTLMTLFGTWKLQGRNPLEACRQMLLAPQPVRSPATPVPA